MGFGFQVSALSQITTLDLEGLPSVSIASLEGTHFLDALNELRARPPRAEVSFESLVRRPDKKVIERWRDAFAERHRAALGERVRWDEDDGFCECEDVRSHDAVMLGHVAFTVTQLGADAGACRLRGIADVSQEEIRRGSAESDRPEYQTRFGQLLGNVDYWLPFRRDLVLVDDDWAGRPRRFGSGIALGAQLDDLCDVIRGADPDVIAWSELCDEEPPTVLAKAWQCVAAMARLATAATERRLPMWWCG